ncbi:hypothetical protein D3C72_1452190 [compost metagenome]
MQQLAVVAVEVAVDAHRHGLAVLAEVPAALLAALQVERQAVVLGQVVQRLRHAVPGEVRRRAAHHALVRCQLDRDEVRIDRPADADAHVIAFAHQVDHAVSQVKGDLHFRVGGEEGRRVRRHVLAPERGRRRHDQVAGGLVLAFGDQHLGAVQVGERLLALLHEHRALLGHGDAARGAVQQLDADARFERVDAAADHHRRDVLRQRRGGHAAVLHHGDKGFDLLEFVHRIFVSRAPLCGIPGDVASLRG